MQELQIGGTRATDAAPAARFLPVLPGHHFGGLASARTVISYSDVDQKLHRNFITRQACAKLFRDFLNSISGTSGSATDFFSMFSREEEFTMKYALIIATAVLVATPALAEEVGVRVGPIGGGVTVGEGHYDRDRDRDRDRTTVIKEREPSERTTVIKKRYDDGTESKTVIHHDRD